MYTYNQIRKELLSQISTLLSIEPKWNKCCSCQNIGRCCIGAEINVYDYEWSEIRSYLLDNPEILEIVRQNYSLHSPCYFRTSDKCLIHEIRPINCLITPYQVIYGADNLLHYTICDEFCHRFNSIQLPRENFDLSQRYISLPTASSSTKYLLLNNWYKCYEEKSNVSSPSNITALLGDFLSRQ